MPTLLNNKANIAYTYQGAASTSSASSNTTVTTMLDQYSLLASKRSLNTTFRPGENITYTFRLENNGLGDLYNATILDDLGGTAHPLSYLADSATLFIDGTSVAITPTVTADSLTFVLPNPFSAKSVAVLTYVSRVSPGILSSVTTIANQATVTARGGSVSGSVITVSPSPSATVTRENFASVSILKQADKATIVSGQTLTYTFFLMNSGNIAAKNIVLKDVLPSGFTVTKCTSTTNDVTTTYTSGQYTIDSATNQITLPSGTGPEIVVPAATDTASGLTTIVITGTVS